MSSNINDVVERLLPCPIPWCDNPEAYVKQAYKSDNWFVCCRGLQGHHTEPHKTRLAAIKQWNAARSERPAVDVREKYDELLFAVAQKHRGETRHETALRYIKEREARPSEGPFTSIRGATE